MANDDNNKQLVLVNSYSMQFAKIQKELSGTNYMDLDNIIRTTEINDCLVQAKDINDEFSKCYNTTSATQIYTYRTLERDLSKIENEVDKSNGIVQFFERVDFIKNLPADLKIIHEKIAMKINEMKKNILESYKNVLMALESGDEKWIADIIKKVDLAEDIDGCKKLIGELEIINKNFSILKLPSILVGASEFKKDLQSMESKQSELKSILDKEETELLQLNLNLSKKRALRNNLTNNHEQKKEAIADLEKKNSTLLKQLEKLRNQVEENKETESKCYKEIIDLKNNQDYDVKNREAREALEKKHLENINSMKTVSGSVLNELTKSTVINKLFHSVFILDESGSMALFFNAVTTSVHKILKNRKEKGRNDEKVSVIKFNNNAEFDVMSASVKSDIKISKLRGGGTSFLKPLEKLEELLQQINADLFIPIIFFLSDGEGEDRKTVVDYCKRIKAAHSKMDFLFFSVGYGADADKETLESMAKTFNNDLSILKIGSEMVKLYHNVENEEHLTNVFSMYEKLFNYQMNLANQKMELVDTFKKNAQDNHIKELAALEETHDMNKKKRELDLKDSTLNINKINGIFTKKIEQIENEIKGNERVLVEYSKEKVDAECDFSKVKTEIEIDELNFEIAKNKYNETRQDYLDTENKMKQKKKDSYDEYDQHREKFLTIYINELKKSGMNLEDEQFFKDTYSSFLQSFSEFNKWQENYKVSINRSYGILDKVLRRFIVINNKFQNFQDTFKSKQLADKMWEIVEIYASYTYGLDRQNDNCEFFHQIMSKCLNFDEDDKDEDSTKNRCIKAFKLITGDSPLCNIFSKFETDEAFLNNFNKITEKKIMDEIKEEKKKIEKLSKNEALNETEKEKAMEHLEKLENDLDEYNESETNNFEISAKTKIIDEINKEKKTIEKISKNEALNETEKEKAMERLEKLENDLDECNDYKSEINRVSSLMLDLRSKAKSAFLRQCLKQQLLDLLKDFIDKDATLVDALNGIKAIEINSK